MKNCLNRKYLSPCVLDARLEAEGILCGSVATSATVDEIHNMAPTADTDPEEASKSYFEF